MPSTRKAPAKRKPTAKTARTKKTPAPKPILRCADLRRSFGSRLAVDGVSFEIAPGETYGLLGPNGAGKTTTVSMICGLLEPDSGEVRVAGTKVSTTSTRAKAGIGYVPQEIALYPDLTADENLRFFGHLYGISGKDLTERVGHTLKVVGLSDRAKERVDNYSGGMKRRLNIAAGLLHSPKLLILDEPTVGVDPQSRNAILENVEALASEGLAVLYTTHYMEEAERLCDRVGIIDEGRIVADGTRRELVRKVGHRDRIDLVGKGDLERFASQARRLKDVVEVTPSDGAVQLLVRNGSALLPRLFEIAARNKVRVAGVEVVEPDLEAVFLHLTGKALRD